MVEVTVQLPEEIARRLAEVPGDISRCVLEAIALEGYRTAKLSRAQVGALLQLDPTQTAAFLAAHAAAVSSPESGAPPTDLELQTFRKALPALLQSERGHFVAISGANIVDRDPDEHALVERVARQHRGQRVRIQRVVDDGLEEVHIDTPEFEITKG